MQYVILCLVGIVFCCVSIHLIVFNKRIDKLVLENVTKVDKNPYINYFLAASLNTIMIWIFFILLRMSANQFSEPKAIDVHRDKTELVITNN